MDWLTSQPAFCWPAAISVLAGAGSPCKWSDTFCPNSVMSWDQIVTALLPALVGMIDVSVLTSSQTIYHITWKNGTTPLVYDGLWRPLTKVHKNTFGSSCAIYFHLGYPWCWSVAVRSKLCLRAAGSIPLWSLVTWCDPMAVCLPHVTCVGSIIHNRLTIRLSIYAYHLIIVLHRFWPITIHSPGSSSCSSRRRFRVACGGWPTKVKSSNQTRPQLALNLFWAGIGCQIGCQMMISFVPKHKLSWCTIFVAFGTSRRLVSESKQ